MRYVRFFFLPGSCLDAHAGGHAKGGGDGGKHRDDDVQDFLPKRFVHV